MKNTHESGSSNMTRHVRRAMAGVALTAAMTGGATSVEAAQINRQSHRPETGAAYYPESMRVIKHEVKNRIDSLKSVTVLNRTIAERIDLPDGTFKQRNRVNPVVAQCAGPKDEKPSIAAIKRGDFAILIASKKDGNTVLKATTFEPDTMVVLPVGEMAPADMPTFERDKLISQGEGMPLFTAINADNELRVTGPNGNTPEGIAFEYISYK